MEHAGLVLEPRPEREVASRRHEPLLERLAEEVRVDVPAADDDADLLAADPAARLEDRRERGGARALGEKLGPLEEHDDRAGDRLVAHRDDVVDVLAHQRERALRGTADRDAVGDRRGGPLDDGATREGRRECARTRGLDADDARA